MDARREQEAVLPPEVGMSHEDAAIALDHVGFAYRDGTVAIEDVSITANRGEIVGVVGPSGCGKSTLLSLMAGLVSPSRGAVHKGVTRQGRHPLAMVFQKDTVLPWLTTAENVRFFARFRSHGYRASMLEYVRPSARRQRQASGAALDERVAELLQMIGLSDSADVYPYQLSGGMRRRLAFLSAVAASPEILLLDEPFSSVDEPSRVDIHQDVFRIARTMGTTTVLVTHDLAEAITLCDRVVILTARPASIATEYTIPFGDERNMLALRETPEYLSIYGELWHDLTRQINASRPARREQG